MTTNASPAITEPNYFRTCVNVGASEIPKHRIVKVSGATMDGGDLATDGGDIFMGVSTEAIPVGAPARSVQVGGRTPVETGGSFSRGAALTSDAQGRAVAAGDGDTVIGRAVLPATGAGEFVNVELGNTLSANGNVVMREQTITHADLTAAATSESIAIGATLPAGARILASEVEITTLFSGGTVSDLDVDLGATDDDAIYADLPAFTGDPTGIIPANGARPTGTYEGEDIAAIFKATGDNVVNLTAGSLTVRLFYVVLN